MSFEKRILHNIDFVKGHNIGNDLVYLPSFYKTLNPLFINKVYTEKEKVYAESFKTPALRYASTFCAKEAVYKALKQYAPDAKIGFKAIEIIRDKPSGTPHCYVDHRAFTHINISLSITHDGDYVWSIVLLHKMK